MAGGLVGLLDDIASLAKAAAASIDDIGAAAGRASVKTAGIVVDDTAVTPTYVQGLPAERELPIIRKIAVGSIRNKLLIILPASLLLSAVSATLVEVVLMIGGTYLCFEGAEKVHHRLVGGAGHDDHTDHDHDTAATADHGDSTNGASDAVDPAEIEAKTVSSAVRTDLVLSAEIMVIALKEVLSEPLFTRVAVLIVVAVVMTILVYGVVALIVKMDDVGLRLAHQTNSGAQRLGRGLVLGMPKLLAVLSTVGTAAMLWVGGHILLVGAAELGWHSPEHLVETLADPAAEVAAIGGVLSWLVATAAAAVVGLAVGLVVVVIVGFVGRLRRANPAAT